MAEVYITPKEEELLLTLSHDLGLPIHELTRLALGLLRGIVENYYYTPVERANLIFGKHPMPPIHPEINEHNQTKKKYHRTSAEDLLQIANEIAQ